MEPDWKARCERCGDELVWLKKPPLSQYEGPFCLRCDHPERVRFEPQPPMVGRDVADPGEVLKP